MPTAEAVSEWLDKQRVGLVTAVTQQPLLVDIEAADLLVELDTHPLVREAIETSPLRDGIAVVHLDAGLIRLGGDIGRRGGPAASRAVSGSRPRSTAWPPDLPSISTERCSAVPARVPVFVSTIGDLSPDDSLHRAAVRDVAALLGVPLPAAWQ